MPSSSRKSRLLWARIVAVLILLVVAYAKPRIESWLNGRAPDSQIAADSSADERAVADNDTGADAATADVSQAAAPAESDTASFDLETSGQPDTSPTADQAAAQTATQTGSSAATDSGKARSTVTQDKDSGRTDQPGRAPPGKLKLIDKQRQKFQSTAGLLYVQGSADGHRLRHVLKHGEDNPDKNIHGVFDGASNEKEKSDLQRDQILAWIDIAYEAGKKGGRGTRMERQGGRVVYSVRMSQRIGYVGGKAGRRDNYPECRYLKLVLQNGNEVVTAYPARSL